MSTANKQAETFEDRLSNIVASGDIQAARRYFDETFALNLPRPEWAQLWIALVRDDKPMMKLLVLWGAKATSEQMDDLQRLDPEKYTERTRFLKQCGMTIPAPLSATIMEGYFVPDRMEDMYESEEGEWKERKVPRPARLTVIKSFVDGEFIDHRIGRIPEHNRKILKTLQKTSPEAFIAGSGLSDAFNLKNIEGLDYYIFAKNAKHERKLLSAFKKAGLPLPPQEAAEDASFEVEMTRRFLLFFSTRYDQKISINRYAFTAAAGSDTAPASLHIINTEAFRKEGLDETQKWIISKYMLDNDQVSCDGKTIDYTRGYYQAMAERKIELKSTKSEAADRVRSLVEKYPDWSVGYWAKSLI